MIAPEQPLLAVASPQAVSAAFKTAVSIGPLLSKRGLATFFDDRLRQPHTLICAKQEDAVFWFLSKRADAVINRWLQNSKLGVLAPVSPQKTGCILITRERLDHVREHRENQKVGIDAVAELMTQLFVDGAASFSWNQSSGDRHGGYDHQLMMFLDTYKSKRNEVSGQSPAAVLSFSPGQLALLRIETAYWIRDQKAKALRKGALS